METKRLESSFAEGAKCVIDHFVEKKGERSMFFGYRSTQALYSTVDFCISPYSETTEASHCLVDLRV